MCFQPFADLVFCVQIAKTSVFYGTGIKLRRLVHIFESDGMTAVIGLFDPRFKAVLLTVIILQRDPLIKPCRDFLLRGYGKPGMQFSVGQFMRQYVDVAILVRYGDIVLFCREINGPRIVISAEL